MKLISIFALVMSVMMPTPATADFVNNRTKWEALSQGERGDYAMGVFDGINVRFWDDNNATEAIKTGRHKCLSELKLSNDALAKLIAEGYAADAGRYSYPPAGVLINQLSKVCRSYINDERRVHGLKPE